MGYQRYRADQILMPLYYKFPKNIADIKLGFNAKFHSTFIHTVDDTNILLETSGEEIVFYRILQRIIQPPYFGNLF